MLEGLIFGGSKLRLDANFLRSEVSNDVAEHTLFSELPIGSLYEARTKPTWFCR
jgi:hypothetical protein